LGAPLLPEVKEILAVPGGRTARARTRRIHASPCQWPATPKPSSSAQMRCGSSVRTTKENYILLGFDAAD
jgi:hypothetical protein